MLFLFDNLKAQKIIFEYCLRPVLTRLRYIDCERSYTNLTVFYITFNINFALRLKEDFTIHLNKKIYQSSETLRVV